MLNVSVDSLWRTLYHEAHRTPEWNTNVAINDVCLIANVVNILYYTHCRLYIVLTEPLILCTLLLYLWQWYQQGKIKCSLIGIAVTSSYIVCKTMYRLHIAINKQ